MSSFKSHPVFYSTLLALGVVVAAEGWLVYNRFAAAQKARTSLERRERELKAFANISPAPTEDMAAQVEVDRERTERALAAMQAELRGRGAAAEQIANATPPAQRPDAFFDIARFVENMRNRAAKLEVAAKPDEAFGFASHANSGPELELIPYVFKQRQIAAYLVDAAFEAHPRRFDGMKRDRPLTSAQRTQLQQALAAGQPVPQFATTTSSGPGAADFFAIDGRISARRPGFVDTMAFRITFSGQTSALRTFLNKLASFELPLLVRSVEVEPATDLNTAAVRAEAAPASSLDAIFGGATASAPAAPAAAAPVPLVAENYSKFTVTVEFVDLLPPTS